MDTTTNGASTSPKRGLKATGKGQPEKAALWKEDPPGQPAAEVVTFLFNPSSFSIKKSASWEGSPARGEDVPTTLFAGGQAATLTISQVLFDTYTMEPIPGQESQHPPSVRTYTDKVVDLMKIDPNLTTNANGTQVGRPPRVSFRWGSYTSFKAVIINVDQSFTLFMPNGTPVRAMLSLTLQEVEDVDVKPPTNPTSRAEAHRIHTVSPGETIDGIAFTYLGDARKWPLIADFNLLDNPLRLWPGQRLGIPSLR